MSINSSNDENATKNISLANSNDLLSKFDAKDKDSIDFSSNNPNAISEIFNYFSQSNSDKNLLSINSLKTIFMQLLGLTNEQADILDKATRVQFHGNDMLTQEQFKNILVYLEGNMGLGQHRGDGILYGATVQTAINLLGEKIFDATNKRPSLSESIKKQ